MAKREERQMPADAADETPIAKDLDALSLSAALRDFEVANARVIDLTQRLIETNDALNTARDEAAQLRLSLKQITERHEAMQGSAAFRIASKIWALRNVVRG